MKLKREIHNDKIHYDIIPRTRLVIPLSDYERMRKKIYRNPQYWFEEIFGLLIWTVKTVFFAQAAAFLICLCIVVAANLDLSGTDLKSFFIDVWNSSIGLTFGLFIFNVLVCAAFSLRPFSRSIYYSHLDNLIASEYEEVITTIEIPADRQEGR
ncbi:hypothetical protein [Neisseria sp. 83E34]|uniref:hypothetical protein n=1 Tax=Neisseria sp. 83E34 TaxID=1692264 RepID=UPI0006CE6D38|nr:hypothetical protein [Neisseria sp. 83E34]KPN72622.1 hypothetical protein AKG09_01975 [Neisseria sp. 83E34]